MVLIPTWNFERKLNMMLNLCYLLHLFCILAITFYSKFQLIWDWCLLKGNSILYNFSRNRENQISKFSWPKMRFKLLLKIVTFLIIFCYFWNFSWIITFSLSKLFFKREDKMPSRKTFFYYFLKNNKMKWNSIKIHTYLILN